MNLKSIKSFLYFNLSEKRSLTLLLLFVCVMMVVSKKIKYKYTPESVDFSCYDSIFTENPYSEKRVNISSSKYEPKSYTNKVSGKKEKKNVFLFDPNQITLDSLKILGFDDYAANNLTKYREKGGRFYKKEDLNKIYGVNEKLFASIKDQIIFNTQKVGLRSDKLSVRNFKDSTLISSVTNITTAPIDNTIEEKKEAATIIDINSADEVQLQYIKGIGPSFARRIIKYRELIGGYHSKEQLMEVYGLNKEKYDEIKDQVKLSDQIKKIDINALNYSSLSKHPYISYQEAKLIVAYRKKHGHYKNAYDIVNIGVMDSSFIHKIIPYIPDSLLQKAQAPLTSL